MKDHILTGFGFGPIQAGLFVPEAYKSGNFHRIIVAEIDEELVRAIRKNKGCYTVNIAARDGIYQQVIKDVEIYNPLDQSQRQKLSDALSLSTEIVTSLPSVDYYETGGENSVAYMLSESLSRSDDSPAIIYTAENNNHAAEILSKSVGKHNPEINLSSIRFLNTVIGKMSQTVTNPQEIRHLGLVPVTPECGRAFLVEEFNNILVTGTEIEGFEPGIKVFIEKNDLLPFEEAKLYGHNAIHALIAYLAAGKNYRLMTDVKNDPEIMNIARKAFINESGASLIKRHESLDDELFTESGFERYADDLLRRMVNPWLNDTVQRAARDPKRKLGINDRIFGTIRLALENSIRPNNMALGTVAGMKYILDNSDCYGCALDIRSCELLSAENIKKMITWLWSGEICGSLDEIVGLLAETGNI